MDISQFDDTYKDPVIIQNDITKVKGEIKMLKLAIHD